MFWDVLLIGKKILWEHYIITAHHSNFAYTTSENIYKIIAYYRWFLARSWPTSMSYLFFVSQLLSCLKQNKTKINGFFVCVCEMIGEINHFPDSYVLWLKIWFDFVTFQKFKCITYYYQLTLSTLKSVKKSPLILVEDFS